MARSAWWLPTVPVVPICLVGLLASVLAIAQTASADPGETPVQPVSSASITAGRGHTCVVVASHDARCWGDNSVGQLGLGDNSGSLATVGDDEIPLTVSTVAVGGHVAALSAGAVHTCALLDSGAVRCWGDNGAGQLGLGNNTQSNTEVGDDETPVSLGDDGLVSLGGRATAISAGEIHTCAILEGGAVRCWGDNNEGQLGLGDNTSSRAVVGDNETPVSLGDSGLVGLGGKAVAISAGAYHTCAILEGGAVRCWGYNLTGQLGLGDNTGSKLRIGDNESPASLGAHGLVVLGEPTVAISSGGSHTCVVLGSRQVRCWGKNADGQLGLGDTLGSSVNVGDNETPASLGARGLVAFEGAPVGITAGELHSCARFVGGRVRCWGDNLDGQLGLGRNTGSRDRVGDDESPNAVSDVGIGGQASAVSAGAHHVCAVLATQAMRCWGSNSDGQLGLGDVAGALARIGDAELPGSVGPVQAGGRVRVDADPLAGPPETELLDPKPIATGTTARFTYSSPDTDVLGFECFLDGVAEGNAIPCAGGAFGGTASMTDLTAGVHTFWVRAVDVAGTKDPTPAGHYWVVEGRGAAVPPVTKPTKLSLKGVTWRRSTILASVRAVPAVTGRVQVALKVRSRGRAVRLIKSAVALKSGTGRVTCRLRGELARARRATMTVVYPGDQAYGPAGIARTITKRPGRRPLVHRGGEVGHRA